MSYLRYLCLFGLSLLQLFAGGLMSYLRYLCLFLHSGIKRILCCIFYLFVPYVASFSGLSILDWPFGLSHIYLSDFVCSLCC